jgi:hypothetical protein
VKIKLVVCLPVIILSLLLAACGSTAGTSANHSQTPSVELPTATPSGPAVTPLSATQLSATCAGQSQTAGSSQTTGFQIGDIIIVQPSEVLAYPQRKLPDSTTLAQPVQLNDDIGSQTFAGTPETNPDIKDEGYGFTVCNNSASQNHTIQSVSVSVASFTSYTGQLNSWQPCNGAYDSVARTWASGCGGGEIFDERVHATLPPSGGVGASATGVVTSTSNDSSTPAPNFQPLPLSLAPGKSVSIIFSLTVPTAPGTYAFTLALSFDSVAATKFWTSTPALFAPVAHQWDGQACQASSMQSQIPTTGPETFYICPAS